MLFFTHELLILFDTYCSKTFPFELSIIYLKCITMLSLLMFKLWKSNWWYGYLNYIDIHYYCFVFVFQINL